MLIPVITTRCRVCPIMDPGHVVKYVINIDLKIKFAFYLRHVTQICDKIYR